MRTKTDRDKAFIVVNQTLQAVKKRLSEAFGSPIPKGFFDPVKNDVMHKLYPPKKLLTGKP